VWIIESGILLYVSADGGAHKYILMIETILMFGITVRVIPRQSRGILINYDTISWNHPTGKVKSTCKMFCLTVWTSKQHVCCRLFDRPTYLKISVPFSNLLSLTCDM
jgi:hypothetical protein